MGQARALACLGLRPIGPGVLVSDGEPATVLDALRPPPSSREDGREGDVFSLIGPKRFDAPWRDIEAQGWIAPARCTEVRVTLADEERLG